MKKKRKKGLGYVILLIAIVLGSSYISTYSCLNNDLNYEESDDYEGVGTLGIVGNRNRVF